MSARPFQTATNAAVVVSTTSVAIFNAGQGANYRCISNTSGQILYVLFGTGTALVGACTFPMAAGAVYEFPVGAAAFSGPVQASTATGSGTILVTYF